MVVKAQMIWLRDTFLSRVLKSLLFQVEPIDPVTLIGVAVLFAGEWLLACRVPTRRAAKIDPAEALR